MASLDSTNVWLGMRSNDKMKTKQGREMTKCWWEVMKLIAIFLQPIIEILIWHCKLCILKPPSAQEIIVSLSAQLLLNESFWYHFFFTMPRLLRDKKCVICKKKFWVIVNTPWMIDSIWDIDLADISSKCLLEEFILNIPPPPTIYFGFLWRFDRFFLYADVTTKWPNYLLDYAGHLMGHRR